MTPEETLRQALLEDKFPETDVKPLVPLGDPLKLNRRVASAAWMGNLTGREINSHSIGWQAEKDALAKEFFKIPTAKDITDESIHDLIRSHIQTSDNTTNLALESALSGRPLPQALGELHALTGVSKTRGIRDRYLNEASSIYGNIAAKVAPYRSIVNEAAGMLSGTMKVNEQPLGEMTDAFNAVAEKLVGIPEQDRRLVIEAIAATGGTTAEERSSYLSKMGARVNRIAETMGAAIASNAFTFGKVLEAFPSGLANKPEEVAGIMAEESKGRELTLLAQQIRTAAAEKLDPVKGNSWLQNQGLAAAEMATQSSIAIASPIAAFGANLAYFRDTIGADVMTQNPGMTVEQSDKVSAVAAPVNAAIETVTALIPWGKVKLPVLQKWLMTETASIGGAARNLGIRAATGTAAEISEEWLQAYAPLKAQQLMGALGQDMPSVDWEKNMPKFADIAAEVWAPALLFSLVGGGVASINDIKNGRSLAADLDMLVAKGIAPELATKIKEASDAGDYRKVDSLFRAEFVSDTKASKPDIQAATERLKARFKAQENIEALTESTSPDYTASVTRTPTGWQVTTGEGTIIPTDTAEGANRIYNELRQVGSQQEANVISEVLDTYFESGMGRGAMVEMTGEDVEANRGGVFAIRRDANNVEVSQRPFGPQALETVRKEAEVAGIKAGVGGVIGRINGSNELFGFRVADTAKAVWRKLSLFKSSKEGNPQIFTLLHEDIESKFREGLRDGTWTEEDARTAFRALVPAFANTVSPVKSAEEVGAMSDSQRRKYENELEDRKLEYKWIENVRKLAAGEGNYTMLQETFSEMYVRDRFAKDRRGKDTGLKPMQISRALEAAVVGANTNEEASALVRIIAMFRAFSAHMKAVFSTVKAMVKARDSGKIGEDWDAFVNKVLGIDEVKQMESQTADEIKAIMEAGNMPFSISPVSTVSVPTSEIDTIPEDLARAEADMKAGGKDWAAKVDLSQPVGVYRGEDGRLKLFDGHHRWLAARERGEPLQVRESVFGRAAPIGEAPVVANMPDGAQLVGPATFSITAYHGTPHKVDKFKTSKIGTGEGAQAFGWGLYMAASREVAEGYRKKLSGDTFAQARLRAGMPAPSDKGLPDSVSVYLEDLSKTLVTESLVSKRFSQLDIPARSMFISKMIRVFDNLEILDAVIRLVPVDVVNMLGGKQYSAEYLRSNPTMLVYLLSSYADNPVSSGVEAINVLSGAMTIAGAKAKVGFSGLNPLSSEDVSALRAGKFNHVDKIPQPSEFVKGNLYTVELLPDEEDFLDWDKPLSEQSEEVKAILDGAGISEMIESRKSTDFPDIPLNVYSELAWDMGERKASERLASLGIPGIKYLDGNSRDGGTGTSNYVIFDESLVKILEENGQKVEGPTFSISPITPAQDAEYLAAVESSDTAKAQAMVDAAAKAAGYDVGPVWHGTRGKMFTVFDRSKIGSQTSMPYDAPKGFYFAKEEKLSERYGPNKIRAFIKGPFMLNNSKIAVVESPNQIKSADPITRDESGQVIPLSQRFNEASPDIRFSISPIRNLNELSDQVERQFAENPVGALEVKSRMIRQFAKYADKWSQERWTPQGNKIRPISEKRTVKSLDKEQAMRQAQREVELVNEGMDKLTPETLMAYSEGVGTLEDDPLVKKMLNDNGRLMSKATAAREGRNIKDQYDDLNWIPPQWYSNGRTIKTVVITRKDGSSESFPSAKVPAEIKAAIKSGEVKVKINKVTIPAVGGIMPDVMADNLGFDTASEMWAALESSIKSHRSAKEGYAKAEAAVKAVEKAAFEQARQEAQQWRDETDAMQKEDWSPKESLVRDLITLEAIVAMFPQEIRGKIGGFVALARKASESARLKVLQKQLERGQVLLEKHLKEQYNVSLLKMLDNAAPVGKPGEVKKSKFIVTVQDELDAISEMVGMDQDDVAEAITANEAAIISAQTPEAADAALTQLNLLELFGGILDLKNTSSQEMEVAHEYLAKLMKQGRDARKIIDEARSAKVKEMVATAKADAFKGQSGPETTQAAKDKAAKSSGKAMLKKFFNELSGFDAVLRDAFGPKSKTAMDFSERFTLNSNEFEDVQNERRTRFRDFARELYQTKLGARINQKLIKLERIEKNSSVTYLKNREVKNHKFTEADAAKIVADPKAFGFTDKDAAAISDEIEAIKNSGGRRKVFTYEQVLNDGDRVEIPLSQMDAVYLSMALRQPGILEQQQRYGYDQQTVEELDKFLADDAKAWRRWMQTEYDAEYQRANEVYMRMFNARMPMIMFYAPLLKNHQGMQAILDPLNTGISSNSANPGSIKSRKAKTSSLRIESALTVFWSHFNQMEYWITNAEYLRDIQAVLLNPEVRESVVSAHGEDGMRTISAWVQLQMSRGVGKAALVSAGNQIFRNIKSGLTMKALALSYTTALKTLPSVFYSLGEIHMSKWPSALVSGMKHWDKLWKTNIIQRRLDIGGMPELRDLGSSAMPMSWMNQLIRYGSFPAMYADGVFTTFSAAMAYGTNYDEAIRQDAGEELANNYAEERTALIVSRTAQPENWTQKSLFENDVGIIGSIYTLFVSDPRQKMALTGEALNHWRKGSVSNEEAMRKVLAYWIIPGIMFQLANAIGRSLFKGDDDEWEVVDFATAALVGQFQGLVLLGSAAEMIFSSAIAAAAEAITGEEVKRKPFWNSPKNPLDQAANDLIESAKKLDDTDKDVFGKTWDVIKSVGMLTTWYSPVGAIPATAERVMKDTTNLFYDADKRE